MLFLLNLSCTRPDYFPLRPGRTWTLAGHTFTITGTDTTIIAERTYTISIIGTRNDSQFGRLTILKLSGHPFYGTTWYLQSRRDGLWLLLTDLGDATASSADWLRILAPPLRPGRAWIGNTTNNVSFEVRAREEIKTPAGHFPHTIPIRARLPETGEFIHYWLAADTGPVRWYRHFAAGYAEIVELVSVTDVASVSRARLNKTR